MSHFFYTLFLYYFILCVTEIMKEIGFMHNDIFDKARKWIYFNARHLDLARFQYLFENGSREAVLSALSEYQNEDGGFGHALEADCFNPLSSPIQTWAATEILNEAGLEEDHSIIRGILRYLESGNDFNGKCWLNTVPSNNDYPHAPWWSYDPGSYDDITYNPTAALAGFALRFAGKDSDLYKKCLGIVKEAIACLKETNKCDEMHVLACYVRMTQYCRKAGLADELPIDEVEEILAQKINRTITWDKDSWINSYVCKPSNFFMDKESFLYQGLKELADDECDFIKNAQKPDGTWPVNWKWDAYTEQWHIAENWWKAHLIIMNLRFLRGLSEEAFGDDPMIRKLYCVNLHTRQIETMKSFYHDILDIPIMFPGYGNDIDGIKLGFDVDALQICLWREERWGKGCGPVEIAVRGKLDDIVKRLEERQYPKFEVLNESYGRCLIIHDPDGNRLSVM